MSIYFVQPPVGQFGIKVTHDKIRRITLSHQLFGTVLLKSETVRAFLSSFKFNFTVIFRYFTIKNYNILRCLAQQTIIFYNFYIARCKMKLK